MRPDLELLNEALEIRYIQLVFVVEFPRDCILPAHKASALRGGMGQRLLEQNCIRNRKCEECDFEGDCMVRRIMYAKNRIPTRYGGGGESNGYIIACDNTRTEFLEGERMTFRVTLLDRVVPYFSQILQAFYQLGLVGLGKDHAPFQIVKVENGGGRTIVRGTDVIMPHYVIRTVREYAAERTETLKGIGDAEYTLRFTSPAAIKSDGALLREFQPQPLVRALLRRIYTMDCYEGIDLPLMSWDDTLPELVRERSRLCSVPRYSTAHESRIMLSGLTGEMTLRGVPEELLMCLAAGEVLHIGSNTSFGFGGYRVRREYRPLSASGDFSHSGVDLA